MPVENTAHVELSDAQLDMVSGGWGITLESSGISIDTWAIDLNVLVDTRLTIGTGGPTLKLF